MSKIDLHLHSTYSDGLMSPEELLKFVKSMDYNIVSITDHDTIAAYNESFFQTATDLKIDVISGVEISSIYKGYEFHLLAYLFDLNNPELNQMLDSINLNRKDRAEVILEKLSALNVNIHLDNIYQYTGENDQIGRMHIARALIENGYCRNISEAFEMYIGDDAPAYCKKNTYSPEEIIRTVKSASGITVLAHPFRIKNDILIFELIEMGLDGIETYYFKHSESEINLYKMITEKYNLLSTGGSDFHGESYFYQYLRQKTLPLEHYQKLILRKEEIFYAKNKC